MHFPQSRITVDNKRAVRVSWGASYQLCGVERHEIELADNEGVECEFRVQSWGKSHPSCSPFLCYVCWLSSVRAIHNFSFQGFLMVPVPSLKTTMAKKCPSEFVS
jgi:hypothetical protein